jgi:hypothetical protein
VDGAANSHDSTMTLYCSQPFAIVIASISVLSTV